MKAGCGSCCSILSSLLNVVNGLLRFVIQTCPTLSSSSFKSCFVSSWLKNGSFRAWSTEYRSSLLTTKQCCLRFEDKITFLALFIAKQKIYCYKFRFRWKKFKDTFLIFMYLNLWMHTQPVWVGQIWLGIVWLGLVWYGWVWFSAVGFGLVWMSMVWCGWVQFGMDEFGLV